MSADTDRLTDQLYHELADAEILHDGERARHLWGELRGLVPEQRSGDDLVTGQAP